MTDLRHPVQVLLASGVILSSACTQAVDPAQDPADPVQAGAQLSGPHAGMVEIPSRAPDPFWIDRYEFPNQRGQKPTVYVDLATAQAQCGAVHKRLCTAAEWRRACEGPEGLRYGYGPRHQDGRCHTEQHLPSGHTSMMDPTELVAASGAFAACTTAEGAVDMVGNAEEWVLDDFNGQAGMLEGGAWYTWSGYADCTGAYSRQPDYRLDPERAVFSAGFRCCWSPSAPTQDALSHDAIAADSQARLQLPQPTEPYDPAAEQSVQPGLFMDLYEYPNRPNITPLTVVSWSQADQRCREAGKRLCQASEWEEACAGPAGLRFPYGNRYVPGACAISASAAPRAGQAYACVSATGVQDMVGSVWEWTASRLKARALGSTDGARLHELRGGSWHVDEVKGVCEPYDGYPVASEDAVFPDVGFRCCRGQAQAPNATPVGHGMICPSEMAAVGPLGHQICVDRTELSGPDHMPVQNVSLPQALHLCEERGKHLCTEAEWLAACAGSPRRRWPYGDEYQAERCNDAGAQAPGHGGQAAAVGSFADCLSPEGVADLSGNVWEWTLTASGGGVLHGGGWNLSAGLNQCRAIARADPDQQQPEFGARCCASAVESATLLAGELP